jgi:hypothetical protein
MKGFVLAGLLSHLEKQYGEEYTDDLIISMNREVSGVYLSMADYPDDTLDILVQTAAKLLKIPRAMLGKILGIHLFAELLVINSAWVEHNDNGLDLLKSHDMALNALTMAAFPGFVPPSYMCTQINSGILTNTGHYKEHFSIEQKSAEQQVGFNRQFIVRRKIPRHLLSD